MTRCAAANGAAIFTAPIFTGEELSEMTVGLIGYGEVGRRVVKLLKAFGCRILVTDPYVQLSADDLRDGVSRSRSTSLLAESDVVSLHPRVTPETTKHDQCRNARANEEGRIPDQHRARPTTRL